LKNLLIVFENELPVEGLSKQENLHAEKKEKKGMEFTHAH